MPEQPETLFQPRDSDLPLWRQLVTLNFDKPIAAVRMSAGAEGATAANVIRFTLQATSRRGKDRPGYWLIAFWLSSTSDRVPVSVTSIAAATGTIIRTTGNLHLVETDAAGAAQIDVEVVGAATRDVHTTVLGRADEPLEVSWV